MFKEITIGDKVIPMLANGATPIRYRMVFGKDIISEFQQAEEDTARATNSVSELAFIMAKAAEAQENKKALTNLNLDSFVEWLEQFEPLDLAMASEDIVNLYLSNEIAHSESKKKVDGAQKEN